MYNYINKKIIIINLCTKKCYLIGLLDYHWAEQPLLQVGLCHPHSYVDHGTLTPLHTLIFKSTLCSKNWPLELIVICG